MDRWLKNNNVVKVISLVLALMLWMVVNINRTPTALGGSQQISSQIKDYQLEALYDEDKYFVTVPSTVQVEIKGTPDYLTLSSLFSGKNDRVYVDLRKLKKGTYSVPVQFEGFPSQAEVLVEPKNVQVTVEELKKVEKPVRVEVIGKVKEGFVMGTPVAKPATVMVSVPESKLQDLEAVQALVNVENATEDISTTVEMRAIDKNGQPIRSKINPVKADVTIPISLPFKLVPLQLNFTGSPPPGYVISSIVMNPASITVFGPKDLLVSLTSYLGPPIDLSKFTANNTLKMKIPLFNQVSKTDPDTVEITVNVSTAVATNTMDIPIHIVGLPLGRTAEILKPGAMLRLQLQGTAENLAKLTVNDIQVTLDVSSLGIGDQNAMIQVKAPYTIKVANPQDSLRAVVRIK